MYKKMGASDGPRNFIEVDKIDTALANFKKAGGKEIMGKQQVPNIGFTFIGADPEGNMIGLFQGQQRPARQSSKRKASRR